MDITEKTNIIKGTIRIPAEEGKYRFLWDTVEKKAQDDVQIMTVRSALSLVPSRANEAERQVLEKIKKSRGMF
jgi:hypothetical protein